MVVGRGDEQSDWHDVSHAPPASHAMEGLLSITQVIRLFKLHTESGTLPDSWFELRSGGMGGGRGGYYLLASNKTTNELLVIKSSSDQAGRPRCLPEVHGREL